MCVHARVHITSKANSCRCVTDPIFIQLLKDIASILCSSLPFVTNYVSSLLNYTHQFTDILLFLPFKKKGTLKGMIRK